MAYICINIFAEWVINESLNQIIFILRLFFNVARLFQVIRTKKKAALYLSMGLLNGFIDIGLINKIILKSISYHSLIRNSGMGTCNRCTQDNSTNPRIAYPNRMGFDLYI